MSESSPLFPCTLVGSYAQPDWLIDKQKLGSRFPPRTRALELWRVPPEFLEEAQDDATRLAILDQEQAGLDIVTDGEMRRESYSNRFATALDGIDIDNPGTALDRSGETVQVPRISGPIKRTRSIMVRDAEFLCAHTNRRTRITVPGPFTMSQQAQNDYYDSDAECARAYAEALNEEIRDLFSAGIDVVSIDEPYMQARAEKARDYGADALNHALEGLQGKTCVHICFGYAALIHERPEGYSFLPEFAGIDVDQVSIETAQSQLDCSILESLPGKEIVLGVLDLSTNEVETVDTLKQRVYRALEYVDAGRIILAPDCGMKYLTREAAFGKLRAMCEAARQLRKEYS